jgi:hypothetical protein
LTKQLTININSLEPLFDQHLDNPLEVSIRP